MAVSGCSSFYVLVFWTFGKNDGGGEGLNTTKCFKIVVVEKIGLPLYEIGLKQASVTVVVEFYGVNRAVTKLRIIRPPSVLGNITGFRMLVCLSLYVYAQISDNLCICLPVCAQVCFCIFHSVCFFSVVCLCCTPVHAWFLHLSICVFTCLCVCCTTLICVCGLRFGLCVVVL